VDIPAFKRDVRFTSGRGHWCAVLACAAHSRSVPSGTALEFSDLGEVVVNIHSEPLEKVQQLGVRLALASMQNAK